MIIDKLMNLDQLAERMSNTEPVTNDDAEKMRDMLVAEFEGGDTRDVPGADWARMLEAL